MENKVSFFDRVGLIVDGIVEIGGGGGGGGGGSNDQSKYVNSLEIRLRSSENDVKSKDTKLAALQTKFESQVLSPFKIPINFRFRN